MSERDAQRQRVCQRNVDDAVDRVVLAERMIRVAGIGLNPRSTSTRAISERCRFANTGVSSM
jgi:hypothetical protein